MRIALITGITGQDGALLADLPLENGYRVHGVKRRSSSFSAGRVDHPHVAPQEEDVRFHLHYGDMTDTTNLSRLVQETSQRETTPFYPRSPYAVAKLCAYWITVNYREAYGFHASNGILFNHEEPTRRETLVTRKISRAVAATHLGLQRTLFIGNFNAKRDWGHARDVVEDMWRMPQQPQPATMSSPRAKPIRCASSSNSPSAKSTATSTGLARASTRKGSTRTPAKLWWSSIPDTSGRPKSTFCWAIRRRRGSALVGCTRPRSTTWSRRWLRPTWKWCVVSRRDMNATSGFDLRGKRIWVAGNAGMVGSAIVRRLQGEDCTILTAPRAQLNLRSQRDVVSSMERERREFPYVDDLADACVFLIRNFRMEASSA